jgi:nucleoside-diphosphate-sugar epimerase
MKALFIGGTGTISSDVTALCVKRGWTLTLINRGNTPDRVPEGVRVIREDINNEERIRQELESEYYDVVADFIAFIPTDVLRDIRLFGDKTSQYIFVSSISTYQKPLASPWITEGTTLSNPYWSYARNKAACEDILIRAWRRDRFPITIVRPGHTYSQRNVPVAMQGINGSFQVIERIRTGKKIIIPGDGLTLWNFTHSRDFAVGFVGLMGNIHAIGEAFHITSDEIITWNQAYECICSAFGVQARFVHIASETLASLCSNYLGSLIGDKSNTILIDNSKIKRTVPEYYTTIRFNQGVRESIRYIYSNPECQRQDPVFDKWCDLVIEGYEQMTASLPHADW